MRDGVPGRCRGGGAGGGGDSGGGWCALGVDRRCRAE